MVELRVAYYEGVLLLYIYKYTNLLNGKIYVGQTNNPHLRRNGHRSSAFNSNDHSYNSAFHNALRKYGEENFQFEIIEEISDELGREYLNKREKYWISELHSLTTENGYNITTGGDGCRCGPRSFEECCKLSKLLTPEGIAEIQKMLVDGFQFFEIQAKYPQIKDSFLSNINTGLNFYNEKLDYPLLKKHSKFTKTVLDSIRQDIIKQLPYSQIMKKYNISLGYVSQINNGTRFRDEHYSYPLAEKKCNDDSYIESLYYDLLFSTQSSLALGKKYGKSKATITAINVGRNRHKKGYLYPLRGHLNENQKIWATLHSTVQTISGETESKDSIDTDPEKV